MRLVVVNIDNLLGRIRSEGAPQAPATAPVVQFSRKADRRPPEVGRAARQSARRCCSQRVQRRDAGPVPAESDRIDIVDRDARVIEARLVARTGKLASFFRQESRSSSVANTTRPSAINAAEES